MHQHWRRPSYAPHKRAEASALWHRRLCRARKTDTLHVTWQLVCRCPPISRHRHRACMWLHLRAHPRLSQPAGAAPSCLGALLRWRYRHVSLASSRHLRLHRFHSMLFCALLHKGTCIPGNSTAFRLQHRASFRQHCDSATTSSTVHCRDWADCLYISVADDPARPD